MKQRMTVLLMACAAMALSAPSAVRAEVNISASVQINAPTDFYQPLTPYGAWVDVGSYGRCWHPRDIEVGWQPYTVGSWEWTDAGWYWNSDEPWAWACYHYGSWYDAPNVGWVWIPGTDWAPAWVTWRSSDAYIGWAPCGPGLSVLAPSFFTFCDIHHFRDHFQRRDLIVNNTTIINRTKVIKNFQRQTVDVDGRQRTIFANKGPGVDPIQRATGAKFTPRPVRDVIHESPHPDNVRRDGDQQQRRDVNQPRDQRPAQEQRPTPAPTGRDEQRNYQQQNNIQQQRNLQQQQERQAPVRPQQPEQRIQPEQKPVAPQQRPDAIPPTGREEPRVYHETPKAPALPDQKREVPVPLQHPVTPPEKPLPPTGRDLPRPEQRNVAPPAQAPVRPAAPPVQDGGHDGHDGHDGKDRNP